MADFDYVDIQILSEIDRPPCSNYIITMKPGDESGNCYGWIGRIDDDLDSFKHNQKWIQKNPGDDHSRNEALRALNSIVIELLERTFQPEI